MIDVHTALIYAMVMASAADQNMTDAELAQIGDIVSHLPAFRDFDTNKLGDIAGQCAELLGAEDGLDQAFDQIKAALSNRMCETAYALACDVVAVDGKASQEELRLLEMMRHAIGVGRLPAAAIERGAAARNRTA
ncbi:MAG: tellurite resistance TerB family protein [Alphaproteobacteria bacterium]